MTHDTPAAPSPRTRVKRLHELARYDRAAIDAILDAMPVAHVGYLVDGAPFVTPTLQWREGDRVYWHGSAASRFLKRAMDHDVCLTVTITDGMVLARSGLNSSVNYRSVMALGRAEAVRGAKQKERHLEAMMERMFPGRWATLRPATAQELKATTVLSLPLDEVSAKVATGMPKDDEADYTWPVWAGVVPVRMTAGPPLPDPRNLTSLAVPDHAARYRIGESIMP